MLLATFALVHEHMDDPMVDKDGDVMTCKHHSPVRSLLEKELLWNLQGSDSLENTERQGGLPECGIVVGGE